MEENNNVQEQTVEAPQGKGMAVSSLVLGIVSIVLMCLWYVSIPCGIVGLVLGILAKKKGQKGMATAGIVLSIIGLVLVVVFFILAAIGVSMLGAGLSDIMRNYSY